MGVKKITVSHKRNDCIGCGSCVLLAPNHWSMDSDDGKANLKCSKWNGKEFKVVKIDEDEIEENILAANACPIGIIRINGYNK